MHTKSVELINLTKIFKALDGSGHEVVAVDKINLHISEGELVTLLGPSGCGKTTTLRMIAGFEFPSSGDVFIGSDKVNMVPANKRPTSMVFQSYALFPHLSVGENVAYSLVIKKLSKSDIRDKVTSTLGLVGLGGLHDRSPSHLSGGQQQRVALARALINEPKVLLFDEPLSNLDAKLRLNMREEK